MKSDIDTLMQAKNLDALVVLGNAENNPPMYYLTGGGHVSNATLIKKRGEEAVLYCNDMERDEAAKSGLKVRLYSEYPWQELAQQAGGEMTLALALRLQRIFHAWRVKGRVGLYGHTDISALPALLAHFKRLEPDVEFVGESPETSLFYQAMQTKSEEEVERIREMGRRTTEVVHLVAEYLTSRSVRADEVLLREDGAPLTIGEVKRKINLWLAERDAVPSEGYIFAMGRDAGVPHSQGNPEDVLQLGRTIIFDIYPQERGGGYFYDFTRTWSLGYAMPEAQALYDQVQEIYRKVIASMGLNASFKDYHRMTCEYFEAHGHKSPMNTIAPFDGYVHSLGHGVGLNIHERPFSGFQVEGKQHLEAGVVVAVEPGLYYPEKGMGVRIEDTYWMRPDGKMECLAEYPYDFVLKMKQWKSQDG
ncbi:MAG: Xaa-Pro peptidase family protein [Anaerolineales bacterium]